MITSRGLMFGAAPPRIDIPGGGQVVVQDGTAFVGHMDAPHGTSILDVSDPKHPHVIAHIKIPEGLHSHKVQVSGDVMVVNYERVKPDSKAEAGLKIFDVSSREKPREIAFYKTAGGVHRFTFTDFINPAQAALAAFSAAGWLVATEFIGMETHITGGSGSGFIPPGVIEFPFFMLFVIFVLNVVLVVLIILMLDRWLAGRSTVLKQKVIAE